MRRNDRRPASTLSHSSPGVAASGNRHAMPTIAIRELTENPPDAGQCTVRAFSPPEIRAGRNDQHADERRKYGDRREWRPKGARTTTSAPAPPQDQPKLLDCRQALSPTSSGRT